MIKMMHTLDPNRKIIYMQISNNVKIRRSESVWCSFINMLYKEIKVLLYNGNIIP